MGILFQKRYRFEEPLPEKSACGGLAQAVSRAVERTAADRYGTGCSGPFS